jgi:hypothetical protein
LVPDVACESPEIVRHVAVAMDHVKWRTRDLMKLLRGEP